MKLLILLTIISVLSLSAVQYYLLTGVNNDVWSSLIINLITEGISILLTILIINKLLQKNKEKEDKRLFLDIASNQYKDFLKEICSVFIIFVQKKSMDVTDVIKSNDEMAMFKLYEQTIKDIIDKSDNYIVAGFRSKPIECVIIGVNNNNKNMYSYQEFCEGVFKSKIQFQIDEFLKRYISIIPEEVRNNIFSIESSIKSFIFKTPLGLGFNQQPLSTTPEEINDIKKEIVNIGESLLSMISIINKNKGKY